MKSLKGLTLKFNLIRVFIKVLMKKQILLSCRCEVRLCVRACAPQKIVVCLHLEATSCNHQRLLSG